jgi:hypothetical protein
MLRTNTTKEQEQKYFCSGFRVARFGIVRCVLSEKCSTTDEFIHPFIIIKQSTMMFGRP